MSIEMQEALEKASNEENSSSGAEAKPEATSPVEEPTDEQAKEELFETPDGRKLTAGQLQVEWREKFLPDYTRKAQKLAEIEKINNGTEKPNNLETPKWKDPNWVPETYGELLELSTQQALERIKSEEAQKDAHKKEVETLINAQLNEIRREEPNLNEDLLFQHANKYQFSDLKIAYENMKEMKLVVKKTEEKVVNNMKSRESEVVNSGTRSGGTSSGYSYWDIASDRGSARDYLGRVSK